MNLHQIQLKPIIIKRIMALTKLSLLLLMATQALNMQWNTLLQEMQDQVRITFLCLMQVLHHNKKWIETLVVICIIQITLNKRQLEEVVKEMMKREDLEEEEELLYLIVHLSKKLLDKKNHKRDNRINKNNKIKSLRSQK